MVTVVDAAALIENYGSTDFLRDQGESLGEEDERTLVDLLTEQIEFANVIVLNKIDAVSKNELNVVKSIIRSLNARAKIIETIQAQININKVMDTGLFNLEEAQEHPLWAQELYNFKDHTPETEEYGITSFVFHASDPFDPIKIHNFFQEQWPGVIRSKGFFWLANRPDFVGEVSQAGSVIRHKGIGRWWIAVPKNQWPDTENFSEMIKKYWKKGYGDRRQEIVFIGLKALMDEASIRKKLEACLITDYLGNEENFHNINDPFPQWFSEL
jgi:G3E family GTPase